MKTAKEISELAGVSVRTLHYYDEIGLLKPTERSKSGYRLYDDAALEALQQILFFREFDLPLKEIRAVTDNPAFDKNHILQMQRKMLVAKKERMECLIASIDSILQGENTIDFEVFSKIELEEMCNAVEANMSEEQRAVFIETYGSLDAWRKQFLESAGSEAAQKNFRKAAEWYGGKERALEAAQHPNNQENFSNRRKELEAVIKKLADMRGADVLSPEVRALAEKYDRITKQMFQLPDTADMVLEMASAYRTNTEIQSAQDSIYGDGTTEFIGRAIEALYKT